MYPEERPNTLSAIDKFLIRFNRYLAYVLIAVVVSILLFGYRLTGNFGFIPQGLADLLHKVYLNIIFLFLFLKIHGEPC